MMELLSRLGVDTAGFDRWTVKLAGLTGPLAWILLVAAVLAIVMWTLSSVRELPDRSRRGLLVFLQVLGMVLIVLLMLRPAIQLAKVARVKDRVAVLVDASASMTLPAGKDGTRSEAAIRFLEDNRDFLAELSEAHNLSYYFFDSDMEKLSGFPEAVTAEGDATDIIGSISSLSGGGAPLSGVVVISDGADTRVSTEAEGGDKGPAQVFSDFPAPVNTVAVGGGVSLKDLAILEVDHDDYGFVHNPFDVVVKVRSEGGLVTEAPVIFRQGDRVLATKTISLAEGNGEAEASLSFTPRQVGEFMFSVEIPPVEGELTVRNNIVRFPLKVLRDKVRILYICGNPSWDERFLRRTLKKNPSVDLVSFYILREHWDDYRARKEEVSLIPFPTEDLFTKELETFDLVIWQNFRGPIYMPGRYDDYMQELSRFVRERGGAFLMIGGHRGFFGQNRMDPNLEGLLPVEPVDTVPNYQETIFTPEVTEEGLRHPIMDVGEGAEPPWKVWSRMPELGGYNRVAGPSTGSLVLMTHPEGAGTGAATPLVAIREVGNGRVMSVMTDCSWYWSMVAAGQGLSNKPYQRFWENALRWLMKDPEMRLLSLYSDRGRVKPGEEVTIMLEVLDESYEPTDDAEVELSVLEQPEDADIVLPELTRYGVGKYRLGLRPEMPGGYRLSAEATISGRSLGRDDVIFEAARESTEYREVLPRPELLQGISEATGGAFIDASGDGDDLVFLDKSMEQVTGTRDLPLWDNWIFFLVTFCVLVAGWYLRRKWGLR